ncbi:hypothetical protein QFC19_009090 [Naganishia cerealis]|uniref:Uncharacterized protein n=1 Tax=Naganishia cerealis TaxID=610337 RepID=A0ACC2UWJ5_9TREE|nr:hypothetical protein QFC19_009090 [Naganishia cerealis]
MYRYTSAALKIVVGSSAHLILYRLNGNPLVVTDDIMANSSVPPGDFLEAQNVNRERASAEDLQVMIQKLSDALTDFLNGEHPSVDVSTVDELGMLKKVVATWKAADLYNEPLICEEVGILVHKYLTMLTALCPTGEEPLAQVLGPLMDLDLLFLAAFSNQGYLSGKGRSTQVPFSTGTDDGSSIVHQTDEQRSLMNLKKLLCDIGSSSFAFPEGAVEGTSEAQSENSRLNANNVAHDLELLNGAFLEAAVKLSKERSSENPEVGKRTLDASTDVEIVNIEMAFEDDNGSILRGISLELGTEGGEVATHSVQDIIDNPNIDLSTLLTTAAQQPATEAAVIADTGKPRTKIHLLTDRVLGQFIWRTPAGAILADLPRSIGSDEPLTDAETESDDNNSVRSNTIKSFKSSKAGSARSLRSDGGCPSNPLSWS